MKIVSTLLILFLASCTNNNVVTTKDQQKLYERNAVCQISNDNGIDEWQSFKVVDLYLQHIKSNSYIILTKEQNNPESWQLKFTDKAGKDTPVLVNKKNGALTINGIEYSLSTLKGNLYSCQ